jgi:CheY-like chemotaxis protein
MARLVVINQSLAGSAHELGEKWVTIGRAEGNSFRLAAESVSGRHCEVQVRGDDLLVRDLLSTNGTFIGGSKISEGVVKPGGTLRVGEIELRYESSARGTLSGAPFTSKMLVGNLSAPRPAPVAGTVPPQNSPPAPPSAGQAGKKIHVLFVDDSKAFLESFGELCTAYSNGSWQVHTAASADRALALLQQCLLDLVVLDIAMPMLDGLQLLSIIKRRYPGVKVAVMTGHATEGLRADAQAQGAAAFLEKPVTASGWKLAFNILNDMVSSRDESGSAAFQPADLPEIIQMECVAGRSSLIEISNSKVSGQIFIEAGAIIHAAAGPLFGERAWHYLLSVPEGEVEVKPFLPPPRQTIHRRWEQLLTPMVRPAETETVVVRKPDTASTADPAAPETAVDHGLGEQIVVVGTYNAQVNNPLQPGPAGPEAGSPPAGSR